MKRLTHSGKEIASIRTQEAVLREIMQEAVEALVFGLLALSLGLERDDPGLPVSAVSLVMAILLGGFCLNRLSVILELLVHLFRMEAD